MSLILTSTISPFLTVSSLWFLEMKSYVTRMQRGFDSPELKNTSGGIKNVELWCLKHSHYIEIYFMRLCVPCFLWGMRWRPLGYSLHRKNTCTVMFFLQSVYLCLCHTYCLMWRFTWLGAGCGLSFLLTGSLGPGTVHTSDTAGACQPSKNSRVYVGMSSSSSGHLVLVILSKS